MKLRCLALSALILSGSAMAVDNCGFFKFTNNLQENLYVEPTAPAGEFCSGQSLPTVIHPGQTVVIPVTANQEPFINVTTDPLKVKIAADYFLKLSFHNGQYNFNDELNTQAFSWNSDNSKLAFCTDQEYEKGGGDCFLLQ